MNLKHTFSRISELAGLLNKLKEESGKVLLLAHERPDGDAVGSLCGLYYILKENAFDVDLVLPEGVPDMYKGFLEEGLRTSIEKDELEKFTHLVFLDCSNQKRCSVEFLREGEIALPTINIDHHPDNSCFGTWNYFNSKAAATCEVLFDLVKCAGFRLTPKGATFLLLGLITDCGCFRYDNTASSTLRAAASLIEEGAERSRIIQNCYQSKPENLALLESDLLCNHLKKSVNGTFAYFYIEPSLLEKYAVDLRNTEQLIDCIRQLEGIRACAVLRKEKGGFKVSLRSKDPAVSVGRIARNLGGGGHEMAAGSSLNTASIEESVRLLLAEVDKEMMK